MAFVRTFVLLMETLASCRDDFLFSGLSLSLRTKSPPGSLRSITIPVHTNISEIKQMKIPSWGHELLAQSLFSVFALSLCFVLAQYLGLELPLAPIYNPCSKHIGTHTHTYTRTYTMAGDSCSGDHDTAACGILWTDVLTPVYTIYRRDRKAQAHAHIIRGTQMKLSVQVIGRLWCSFGWVWGTAWQIKVVFHVCGAIRVKPLKHTGLGVVLEPCVCSDNHIKSYMLAMCNMRLLGLVIYIYSRASSRSAASQWHYCWARGDRLNGGLRFICNER